MYYAIKCQYIKTTPFITEFPQFRPGLLLKVLTICEIKILSTPGGFSQCKLLFKMSEERDVEKSKPKSTVEEDEEDEDEEELGESSSGRTFIQARSQHHPPAQSSSSSIISRPSTSKSRLYKNNIKFIPKEELVKQIMDMGICRNGAVKALYWTGNQSALAASNWIFDQPDRDLDTPLEDELEMIRAQQAEREREEREEREFASRMCLHHHHHHAMEHNRGDIEDDDIDEEDVLEEEEEDEDDEEEEEDIEEDDDDMEFKMVFVVNKSLELRSGMMSVYVGKATAGLFRKINSQPQSVLVGPDELSMWGDLGEKMIALSADSDQHMKDLELMAKNLRLPCQMIEIYVVSIHTILTVSYQSL